MFEDSSTKIMPVFDDKPSVVKKRWDTIMAKAKYYSWAEHEHLKFNREGGDKNRFSNWPRSLYKSWQTNSNTFVRYVAGDLMTEMSGSRPGDQTPSQNSIDGYRFSPHVVPWKDMPDPKRPGAR